LHGFSIELNFFAGMVFGASNAVIEHVIGRQKMTLEDVLKSGSS